ncbi:MAG: tetratricopeptide repeat protein [Hormoscilla sp. SP5CHS1]|nr:tetratricopeptide repeat protein [Hormoscilla sp. SP12CHS1]MBC6455848.1 tetratricopeptide repeat protein [Hormoscilla sp. SP5CHS1]MBC6475376.1 tetratricopeptide repeat protein [Hormoscilla sp. GM102CHS1]
MGVTLWNLERHEKAIASFDRALEIKPDEHEASWLSEIVVRR